MNIALAKAWRSLKQINFEVLHAVWALIILLFMLWYRWFMVMQSNRLTTTIAEKNQELMDTKKILADAQKDRWYLKLLASKYLETETKTINWEQSLKYLIGLLEQLKSYNQQNQWVDLANFQIDAKRISLQWRVSWIKDIYAEWWIIDTFNNYPFVQFFNMPSFIKNEEMWWYDFYLDADILHYDWSKPTS
jgi:hypothetical protein